MKTFYTYTFCAAFFFTLIFCEQSSSSNRRTGKENSSFETTISCIYCFGQQSDTGKTCALYYMDEMPVFPGGEDSLISFLKRNIEYPESAIRDGIEGTVYVKFVIDVHGNAIDPEILRGIRGDLDSACLAVIHKMSKWKVVRQNGKPVPVYFNLPIKFVLDSSSTKTESKTTMSVNKEKVTNEIDTSKIPEVKNKPETTLICDTSEVCESTITEDCPGPSIIKATDTCEIPEEINAFDYPDFGSIVATDTTEKTISLEVVGVPDDTYKPEVTNKPEILALTSIVYPNPTNDIINIELHEKNTVIFLLTDLNGKIIFRGQFSEIKNKIDLSAQADGVYVLTLINTGTKQKSITKIIKTK